MNEMTEKMQKLADLFSDVWMMTRYFSDNPDEIVKFSKWIDETQGVEISEAHAKKDAEKIALIMEMTAELAEKADIKLRQMIMGDFLDDLFGGAAKGAHVIFMGGRYGENVSHPEEADSDEENSEDSERESASEDGIE